jgi:adenosylhomocysteine nucleosidase
MIGFIVALASESSNLLKKIPDVHTNIVSGYEVYVLNFFDNHVYLVYSGVGKVNAAMATQILIGHFKVTTVINVGSCGGLASNLAVGDIVIPNVVSYYDVNLTAFGYRLNQIPQQPADFDVDQQLNKSLVNILKLYGNHLSGGKLISGDTFINQSNIKNFQIDEKAVAIDMESAAIAHTCLHNKVSCAFVKVISDVIFLDEKNAKK